MVEQATRQMERLIASWPPPPDSPGLTPPKPGHIVVDAIRVEMTKAHSKLDPAKVLKKEKQLVYVFSVQENGDHRDNVTKRFSEVKKFWESLTDQAEACGADLPPFPRHSAFLSGNGVAGNLYESDAQSDFAAERLELLRGLAEALTTATNATGGSLFGLRLVRAFFELDKRDTPLMPVARPVRRRYTLDSAKKRLKDAQSKLEALALASRPSLIGAFLRATPCAFCACFVLALTVLTGYT